MKNNRHLADWIYNGLLLILAIMSVYFFKERLFADSSYMIFKTINKGWFHIEHGRPAHGITQFFPLVGYALHLPLKALLILYSLGQVVFFYLLFWILNQRMKSPAAIIALFGVILIGVTHLYYVAMLEILLGGTLAVLVASILYSQKWKNGIWLLILFFSYWFVLTSHPLNFLLALVVPLIHYRTNGWEKKIHIPLLVMFLSALFLEWMGHDSYEAKKFVGIKESGLSNLYSSAFIKDAIILVLSKYWLIILLGASSTLYFLRKRKWLLAALWPASSALLFLGAIYRWDISQDDWYTEVVYQPLVSISMIIFCFGWLSKVEMNLQRNWQLFFSIFFLGFIIHQGYTSDQMQDRTKQIEYLTDHLQHQNIQKAEINLENVSRPYNNWIWSVPVEALLLSAIDGPEQSLSLISPNEMNYQYNRQLINDSNIIFRQFDLIDHEDLNKRYFSFKKGEYEKVNTNASAEAIKTLIKDVSIFPNTEDSILIVPADQEYWVDITVVNEANVALPSNLESNLYIAPHWYHKDTLYNWDGRRTALELDIIGEHHQQIKFQTPKEEGIYEVQFDMVKEGEFWMMLQPKYIVQVY